MTMTERHRPLKAHRAVTAEYDHLNQEVLMRLDDIIFLLEQIEQRTGAGAQASRR